MGKLTTIDRKREYVLGQRLTEAQKKANDMQWYKDNIDNALGVWEDGRFPIYNAERDNMTAEEWFKSDRYRDMRINYDLYDGKLKKDDFKYVYSPYGLDSDTPADFTNKDIISKRVNAIDGMERERKFAYKVMAVNPEATTRREQESARLIREYVIEEIMKPVREQLQQQAQGQVQQLQMQMQQAQAKGASQEELQQIQAQMNDAQQRMQQQMAQQEEQMTPDEVMRYMQRDHQDPADILGNEILSYVRREQDMQEKLNIINKDLCCVGKAIAFIGEKCGKPVFERVNPMGFNFLRSTATHYIEDSEWCSYEKYLNPSEITMEFGDELSDEDMNELLRNYSIGEDNYIFTDMRDYYTSIGIRVVHVQWKDSKRIGFLAYRDTFTGEENETIVSDGYKLDKENGDISIRWEWVCCVYEGWKIGADKYVRMREVPGQFNDLNNINNREKCKLSYKGVWTDVSLIDRMKPYQFLYSIIWYRIEMLMARDKGKTVAMDANLIDGSMGVDKFLEVMENTGIMFFNRNTKEGDRAVPFNIGEAVKEINRGLGSDIQQYQEVAEYIDQKCGDSVGINQQIIGNIHRNESVGNTQMAVENSATVLEHHFGMFNHFKMACLEAMVDTAKNVFMKYQPEVIQYVLDDMSVHMLRPDYDLLDQSIYGVFAADTVDTNRIFETIIQMIQPAMQNQAIEMSDIVKILKAESIQEAEEMLLKAEEQRRKFMQQQQESQQQAEQQALQMKNEAEKEKIQMQAQAKMEQIRVQGEIDMQLKQIDLQRQVILAQGFDTDKDRNDNGIPDVVDQYKLMLDEIKARQKDKEIALKERKQNADEREAERRHEIDLEKLKIDRRKSAAK